MRTIILATSKFGTPVTDYFKTIGYLFSSNGYRVIFLFDGKEKAFPEAPENVLFFSWPSKRPTKFADFVFLGKVIRKYKPVLCLSNFGSTNVMTLMSFFLGVRNRVNYIHTTTVQIETDSTNRTKLRFLKIRKKIIYMLCTHYFTNSNGTKQDTIKNYGIKAEKITVFPLLLSRSILDYKTKEKRERSIVIVGRLHPSKGHEELIEQFAVCLKRLPELKLRIIGGGHLEGRLKEKASELGILENVIFMGSIPNERISNEYRRVLASVSSSIDEAYGLVNIEALREGTPLICTVTAGSKDILEEDECGGEPSLEETT